MAKFHNVWSWLKNKYFKRDIIFMLGTAILFIFIAIIATSRSLDLPLRTFDEVSWTGYNNFLIFKNSFQNLIQYQDLYILYPDVHGDLFKYSPTFALLMGPFALLSDGAGLLFWNLLNVGILFLSVRFFPHLAEKKRVFILLFIAVELLTSTHNDQCNALIVGLVLLAFSGLERGKSILPALLIVFTFYIKLFGLVTILIGILYPQNKRFFAFTAIWMIILAFLPLLVIDLDQLLFLYKSWWSLLTSDYEASIGLSVAGIWQGLSGYPPPKAGILFAGVFILLLPLYHRVLYKNPRFRHVYMTAILIWIVLFNHKAEGATFVIAMTGIALWFATHRLTMTNMALIIFTLIFTSFADRSGLFSIYVRESFIKSYAVKAVPSLILWIIMIRELLWKPQEDLIEE